MGEKPWGDTFGYSLWPLEERGCVRRSKIMVAATTLLLVACQSDAGIQPIEADEGTAEAPSPQQSEEPEPEPEPEDPFAVPDDIDVAYAQRVFDELFRIQGDAYRITYEQREETEFVPTEALDLLRSISVDEEEFEERASILQRDLDGGFERRRIPLADRDFTVDDLTRADASCIVAEGPVDLRTTSEAPSRDVVPHSYALTRDDEANTTGWVFAGETAVIEGFEPLDPEEVCQ